MDDSFLRSFPDAALVAATLVTRPEVAERWTAESACAGMSVGGLAHHLADQTAHALRLLGAEPTADAPIPVLEHYRRAAWVHAGLDAEVNVAIREGADGEAAGGPGALAERVRRELAALPEALAPSLDGTRVPDTVHIPWQGWSLATRDFLVTRAMEMMVHADDLAASLGEVDGAPRVPTPEFPEPVAHAVLDLLASVAAERHGQAALVRALSRPQRAPASVSAF